MTTDHLTPDLYLDLFAALAAPFAADQIRTRPQGPRQIQYITARTVMNRLDDVLGPGNWWDDYSPQPNSVICRLSICLPDGGEITKCDAGGYAGMPDEGDDDKSGYSDAFKRAAVKFGIGRHLYGDGIPQFVVDRIRPVTTPPRIVNHAPAIGTPAAPVRANAGPTVSTADQGPPTTGKALYAWARRVDTRRGSDQVVRYLQDLGRAAKLPTRFVDWSDGAVTRAYAQAAADLGLTTPPLARGA